MDSMDYTLNLSPEERVIYNQLKDLSIEKLRSKANGKKSNGLLRRNNGSNGLESRLAKKLIFLKRISKEYRLN
jgi:hypothetical protein